MLLQEEACMLLYYLESQNVYIVIEEQYVLDEERNKKDYIILCIIWWTLEQIRMACRFVSDIVAETNGTFNTKEKYLLLQCFIGINNIGLIF